MPQTISNSSGAHLHPDPRHLSPPAPAWQKAGMPGMRKAAENTGQGNVSAGNPRPSIQKGSKQGQQAPVSLSLRTPFEDSLGQYPQLC